VVVLHHPRPQRLPNNAASFHFATCKPARPGRLFLFLAAPPTMSARKSRSRGFRSVFLPFLLLAAVGGWLVFGPAVKSRRDPYLYIRTGSTYTDVQRALRESGAMPNTTLFDAMAKASGYTARVQPGRYHLPAGASRWTVLRTLRAGRQSPVRLVIGKLRTERDLVRLLSTKLEADSGALDSLLADRAFVRKLGVDSGQGLVAVIPDTYEFWWTTDAAKALQKLADAQQKFWTGSRKAKAEALGLSVAEAVTLASIVEEETNTQAEKDTVASVYLNRLRTGMKLQADPTARWAGGDFTIHRITSAQTGLAHPYNTYHAAGLPPAPICTPSKATLDAVLAAPRTPYLYFCAKEDFSGAHRFAASYDAHLRNARLYQAALDARGIR